jgi:cyanophycin synthetase
MNDTIKPAGRSQAPAPQRAGVRLVREAAASLGIHVETYCGDWVLRLIHPDGRTRLVWGYNFDLNPSAAARVAGDKAATFEVLRAAGVAAVEHRLFLRADLSDYVSEDGSWRDILAAFEGFGGDAVIKPADGSGGSGVSRVRSARELEAAAGTLWQRTHAICLSPFVAAAREVRFILLDGAPRIVYEKQIAFLAGDGHSSTAELVAQKLRADPQRWGPALVSLMRDEALDWSAILPADGRRPVGWKHNLRGAQAVVVEPRPSMTELARRASAAMGLRICAVDVVEAAGAAPQVLEVNAGLMLERYVEQVEGGWDRAHALTRDVIVRMFAQQGGAQVAVEGLTPPASH